jgi:hypothetical protein
MTATSPEDDHEYVEFLLEIRDGQIVSCEYFGSGRQVEPLTGPVWLRPYVPPAPRAYG